MAEYKTLIYEPGVVTKIIHNEAERNNVMGAEFQNEFLEAINEFEKDREARVVVSLSKGKHFSAGHDISTLGKKQSWASGQQNEWAETRWRRVCDVRKWAWPVWDIAKPMVAGVQGAAFAAGAQFVMMHDIVIMGESAYMGFSIARVSGLAGTEFPMWLGYRKAFELLTTGWNVSSKELYRLGAINKVVPDDKIEAEALKFAEVIALMPPETVKLTKASLKFGMDKIGARERLWKAEEDNILTHCVGDEREKEFYRIMRDKGVREGLQFRDGPFEKYGYSRHGATEL